LRKEAFPSYFCRSSLPENEFVMLMTIIALVFFITLLGSAFVVGRWLENHERGYKR
jgi:hypothetical protein